jgi:general secretion pathway protein I
MSGAAGLLKIPATLADSLRGSGDQAPADDALDVVRGRSNAAGRGGGLQIPMARKSTLRGDGIRMPAAGRSTLRGYTLIEVIVAFAILALALTLLLGTLSGATRQVRWADEAGRAALHAQSLLDQVGVGEALQPGHRDGDFEHGRYRWSLDVAPYQDPLLPPPTTLDLSAPRLLQLSLTVQWGDAVDDPRRRLQLQSLRLVTPGPINAVPPP